MTKTFFNRYFKVLAYVTLFALAFMATSAFAEDDVFKTITERLATTFKSVRTVIFIVGGFGLVGLGFAAIFGKIKWTWLAALAAGLAIVALAGAVVNYVTQQDGGSADGPVNWDNNIDSTLTGGGTDAPAE